MVLDLPEPFGPTMALKDYETGERVRQHGSLTDLVAEKRLTLWNGPISCLPA
jgi:hypothetical protein